MARMAIAGVLALVALAGCGGHASARRVAPAHHADRQTVLFASDVDVIAPPRHLSRLEVARAHGLLRSIADDCAALREAGRAHDSRAAARLFARDTAREKAFLGLYNADQSRLRAAATSTYLAWPRCAFAVVLRPIATRSP